MKHRIQTATESPVVPGEDAAQTAASHEQRIWRESHLPGPTILQPRERRRREDAVRFANGSIALEGFKVGDAEHAHADRFIAGEIDLTEFLPGQVASAACGETSALAPNQAARGNRRLWPGSA
jgi:hypothetical protein